MQGYWIYSAESAVVPLVYNPHVTGASKHLYTGWNTFGPFGTKPIPANEALFTINKDWTTVLGFNAPYQIWDPAIINSGSGQFSDTHELIPMKGYWLFMTTDGHIDIIT